MTIIQNERDLINRILSTLDRVALPKASVVPVFEEKTEKTELTENSNKRITAEEIEEILAKERSLREG